MNTRLNETVEQVFYTPSTGLFSYKGVVVDCQLEILDNKPYNVIIIDTEDTTFASTTKDVEDPHQLFIWVNFNALRNDGKMSEAEIKAIMAHELGHNTINNQKYQRGSSEKEIDADLFAARKIGKRYVLSALYKTIKMVKNKEDASDERKERAIKNTKERITALKMFWKLF